MPKGKEIDSLIINYWRYSGLRVTENEGSIGLDIIFETTVRSHSSLLQTPGLVNPGRLGQLPGGTNYY